MLEESTASLYQQQKNIKPQIEEIISEYLYGELIQSALDFVAWLRVNKLSVKIQHDIGTWIVHFKGIKLCYLRFFDSNSPDAGSWRIDFIDSVYQNETLLSDEHLTKIVWENLKYCSKCCGCRPGRCAIVFGKVFDGFCRLAFYSPGADEIECMKKLILATCDITRSPNGLPKGLYAAHDHNDSKTKIDEYIPERLEGGTKKAAQEFFAYLQANKIKPKWYAWNQWRAGYKGIICNIDLAHHTQKAMFAWAVGVCLDHMDMYESDIKTEGLQDIIWDSLTYCRRCGRRKCAPGMDRTVLGKEFKSVCVHCPPTTTWVYDPDEATIDGIKRLLDLERNARDESKTSN